MDKKEWYEEQASCLWQGIGINIDDLMNQTNDFVNLLISNVPTMEKRGIVFPMEYVMSALSNLYIAIESKDDYKLADCLYYEWKEICIVYSEIIEEIGENK